MCVSFWISFYSYRKGETRIKPLIFPFVLVAGILLPIYVYGMLYSPAIFSLFNAYEGNVTYEIGFCIVSFLIGIFFYVRYYILCSTTEPLSLSEKKYIEDQPNRWDGHQYRDTARNKIVSFNYFPVHPSKKFSSYTEKEKNSIYPFISTYFLVSIFTLVGYVLQIKYALGGITLACASYIIFTKSDSMPALNQSVAALAMALIMSFPFVFLIRNRSELFLRPEFVGIVIFVLVVITMWCYFDEKYLHLREYTHIGKTGKVVIFLAALSILVVVLGYNHIHLLSVPRELLIYK